MMAKTTFHEKISREISKVPDPSALRSYGHHESGRTETESFQSKAARPQEACPLCKDHPGRRLAAGRLWFRNARALIVSGHGPGWLHSINSKSTPFHAITKISPAPKAENAAMLADNWLAESLAEYDPDPVNRPCAALAGCSFF
jgi:hypothetical protein